ncbi:2-amino-4-hydroxy-6-hydroxymethyldihydropteridine diphosphokinase [candidate division KSB1 bacterium]|nr:2-amino-4-hydroxy-6-hydroxymethyldihydropteridine diphosphokinase [candidate division KSB1 bacterium]
MMNKAIIALGANIKPAENISQAKVIIARNHKKLAESSIVETQPIGYTQQPNFLNGTMLIETKLSRSELAKWLKQVEKQLGRVRTKNKNGPRTIDLDIVVWNNEIVDNDVYERDFLWNSVREVAPDISK